MSSFTLKPFEAPEQMAQHVVSAFQHGAPQEFVTQFPTLKEFHRLMDENPGLYGDMLPEAKKEMTREYETELLPQATEAFQHMFLLGRKKGIDWNAIQYVRTEVGKVSESNTATLTITFTSNKKEFRLIVENAMIINNEWKVSQYLHLI